MADNQSPDLNNEFCLVVNLVPTSPTGVNGNVASVGEPSSNGAGPSTTTSSEQNGSAPDHHSNSLDHPSNGVDNTNGVTGDHSEGNDSTQVRMGMIERGS